jgi:Glycosyl hydrolases family 17
LIPLLCIVINSKNKRDAKAVWPKTKRREKHIPPTDFINGQISVSNKKLNWTWTWTCPNIAKELSKKEKKMSEFLTLLFFISTFVIYACADANQIGICHGRVGDNLPSPDAASLLLKSNGILKARLFLPDPTVLPAFNRTGIELTIGVPNENLTYLATSDVDIALNWLKSNIFSFVSPGHVRYLVVGNEVLYKDTFYSQYVVPAINNLYEALQILGLDKKIKLSSAHASSVLSSSYPPSAGAFDQQFLSVLRPMLQLLNQTGSPFMVNTYPFFSYINDPTNVPLSYALFGLDAVPVKDGDLVYTNLFDATIDAILAAMEREGFKGIPVAVTETGWPTAGHVVATKENAAIYNGRIMERVRTSVGTPRRPGEPVEVYLFDLYDENLKSGGEFEKHFGIFNLDGSKLYNIDFS